MAEGLRGSGSHLPGESAGEGRRDHCQLRRFPQGYVPVSGHQDHRQCGNRPEARRQVELEPLEISPQAGEQEEYDERIGYQSSFAPLSGTARSRKARRKKQAEQQEDEQD